MLDTHWLCIGILAGMVIVFLAPGWLKIVAFVAALWFSGLLGHFKLLHSHEHFHWSVPPLLYLVGGVAIAFFGWHYARRRGLVQLGDFELENRWRNLRTVSKWGW
jgi:hypothetical protein